MTETTSTARDSIVIVTLCNRNMGVGAGGHGGKCPPTFESRGQNPLIVNYFSVTTLLFKVTCPEQRNGQWLLGLFNIVMQITINEDLRLYDFIIWKCFLCFMKKISFKQTCYLFIFFFLLDTFRSLPPTIKVTPTPMSVTIINVS